MARADDEIRYHGLDRILKYSGTPGLGPASPRSPLEALYETYAGSISP